MSAVNAITTSAIDMDCKYRSFLCKLSDFTNENYNEHSSGLKEVVKYLFGELVSLDDVVCRYIFDFIILSREFVARLPDRCHIDAILIMAKSIIGRPVLGNEDFRVYFETIFTLLLYHVDFQGIRNKLHFDHDSFFKDYPTFYELSIIDKVELKNLLLFRNWMNVALLFIPAHSNKGRLMNVATRLSEGCMFKYVTGSGQSILTERRVKIYEHEGRATKTPRHKRRIGEMLVLEKLGYTIDFESNSDSESDNEDHSNNIDSKIGTSLPLVNATKKADNDKSNKKKRKRECVRKIIDVIQISKEMGSNVDDAIQRNSKNIQIGNVVMKVNVRPIDASNSATNNTSPHPSYSSVVDDLKVAKSSMISGPSSSISNVPSFNINRHGNYVPVSDKNSNLVDDDTNMFSNVEHPNTQPLLLSETQTSVTSSSLVDVFASLHSSKNTSVPQFTQPSPLLPSLSSLLPHVSPSAALPVTSQINSQTTAILSEANTKLIIAASSAAHSKSASITKTMSSCDIPDTLGTKLTTKVKGNPSHGGIPLLYSSKSSLPLPEADDFDKNDGLEDIDRELNNRNSSFETSVDRTVSGSSRTSGITMTSKTELPLNITNHHFHNPTHHDIQAVLKHACYLGKSNYGQVVTPDESNANKLPMTHPTDIIINNPSSDELKSLMLKTEMHLALLRDLEKDFENVFTLCNSKSNNVSELQTAVTFVSEALIAIEAAKSSLEYQFTNQLALEKVNVKAKELLSSAVTSTDIKPQKVINKDTKNLIGEKEKIEILNDLDNQWVMDKESFMNQNTANKIKSENALTVEQSTSNLTKSHAYSKNQSHLYDILSLPHSLPPSHHMSYQHEYHHIYQSHALPYTHVPPDYYMCNSYPPPMYPSYDGHRMYPPPPHSARQYLSYNMYPNFNQIHNQPSLSQSQNNNTTNETTKTIDDHDSDEMPLKSHKNNNNSSNHKNKTNKKSNWF